jgi:hypothetical protein
MTWFFNHIFLTAMMITEDYELFCVGQANSLGGKDFLCGVPERIVFVYYTLTPKVGGLQICSSIENPQILRT